MKTVTCTMISGSFKTHIIKYLPAYVQKSYQLITLTFTSIQSNQNRTFKMKVHLSIAPNNVETLVGSPKFTKLMT